MFSGTLTEGRILVDAKGGDVTLVLNGADITCSTGSPLYIYQSACTTVHVMEGTENALTDGSNYTFADSRSSEADDEPNACLCSKSDLVLQGAGGLTVNGNYRNGITGKDTLEIYDLTLTVTAVGNGISGKDSNTIDSANITVACGEDAIRSTNDTDAAKGWVRISNSVLNLTAGEDGIQSETDAILSSGSYTITSGGGSTILPDEDVSAKGIKAGGELKLLSGLYVLDCSDDAVHSNGNVAVAGGVYTVSSGDDAFHSDGTLAVSGGQIDILTSYEGLEGSNVEISGGTLLAVGSGGMPQAPSSSEQPVIYIGLENALEKGSLVAFTGEEQQFIYEMPIRTANLVFSAPELKQGGTYAVSTGGTCTGDSTDGVYSDGTYSGGTVLTELTLTETITRYGSSGSGFGSKGNRGGMTQDGTMQPGDKQRPMDGTGGDWDRPADGTMK